MKNFRRSRENIDVSSFLEEIKSFTEGWSDTRAKQIPLHKDTLSIFLRVADLRPGETPLNCERDRKTEHYRLFPCLTAFLEKFAENMNGKLSRVNIVSLKPESQVYRHHDAGRYYKNRDRYHLILQSPSGSRFLCGDEEAVWREGEVWWFNNKLEHEAFNDSGEAERIHVIFDIKPFTFLETVSEKVRRIAEKLSLKV
jgi:hypothetical protein